MRTVSPRDVRRRRLVSRRNVRVKIDALAAGFLIDSV